MNSTSTIRNYKHDIAGKFKYITMAISAMDDEAFNDPKNH